MIAHGFSIDEVRAASPAFIKMAHRHVKLKETKDELARARLASDVGLTRTAKGLNILRKRVKGLIRSMNKLL